jgi:hypothetical protein
VVRIGTYIRLHNNRLGRVGSIEKSKAFKFEVREMAFACDLPEYGIEYVPVDEAYNGRQVCLHYNVTAVSSAPGILLKRVYANESL